MGGIVTFDQPEYERWLATADDHLLVARHDAEGGFHNAAVLQAERAAQCALKALLHGVGEAGATRRHGLLTLAASAGSYAGLSATDGDRQDLARLAREYLPSRYPDALPEGTPRGHFTEADSAWAAGVADRTVAAVRSAWTALREQAD
jgi:HEPN domain-containing protein